MKKLSPVMQALADDAPKDWAPTPEGYLVVLRRLQARRLVEITQAPGGWAWRRMSRRRRPAAAERRKAS